MAFRQEKIASAISVSELFEQAFFIESKKYWYSCGDLRRTSHRYASCSDHLPLWKSPLSCCLILICERTELPLLVMDPTYESLRCETPVKTIDCDEIVCSSFNLAARSCCSLWVGHKVKLAHQWIQQLMRTSRSLNEILFGHKVKFCYSFRA